MISSSSWSSCTKFRPLKLFYLENDDLCFGKVNIFGLIFLFWVFYDWSRVSFVTCVNIWYTFFGEKFEWRCVLLEFENNPTEQKLERKKNEQWQWQWKWYFTRQTLVFFLGCRVKWEKKRRRRSDLRQSLWIENRKIKKKKHQNGAGPTSL